MNDEKPIRVAVIIPSLANAKTRPYLKLTVESLRATTDWDIIVVTNGTKAPEPLAEIEGITMRLHTRDQGQANAVNIGVQAVDRGVTHVMVSNDDMYYAPGWNKNLRFDYPVFSPNLIEPTDNAGSAPPFLKLNAGFTLEAFDEGMVDYAVSKLVKENKGVKEPGFNLPFFIRKDVWDTIGGYDIAYDPWGSNSDTDLQTKINLAGITPMRLRDILVYHFSCKSGTFDPENNAFYQNNFEYFKSKWGFDRDELKSDVWHNHKLLPRNPENIKYKPEWAGKYEDS